MFDSDVDYFIDEFIGTALRNRLRNFYQDESFKGCSGKTFDESVDIRSPFECFQPENFNKNISSSDRNPKRNPPDTNRKIETLRIWFNKRDDYKIDLGEAIVKIGSEVAKVRLNPPRPIPQSNNARKIRGLSFIKYYRKKKNNIENKVEKETLQDKNVSLKPRKRKRFYETFD